MMGWTHLVVSATTTSLILGTANPAIITVGAVCGLLPDVDISTSAAGKVLPWVSHWLERRFPHRSCTHSLFASGVVATVTYGSVFLFGGNFGSWLMRSILAISLAGSSMPSLNLGLRYFDHRL